MIKYHSQMSRPWGRLPATTKKKCYSKTYFCHKCFFDNIRYMGKPCVPDGIESGSFTSNDLQTPGRSRIPVLKDQHTNSTLNRQRTPSGSTTPVRSGQQTAVSRLLRKPSDASESGTPATPAARRAPATPKTTEKREPFRL